MNSLLDKAADYRTELVGRIVPFWLENSPDIDHGGHFSCLTGDGRVFDTDKFVWMESRLVWMFSRLASERGMLGSDLLCRRCRDEAERGVRFLLENGRNHDGDWFFSLDRKGAPLVGAYNIFSDFFALMGLAEYAGLTGIADKGLQERAADAAEQTWIRILQRRNDPKGRFSKAAAGARHYRPLNWPMILLNTTQVLEDSPLSQRIGSDLLRSVRFQSAADVLEYHLDTEGQVLRERVSVDGTFLNENMEGRLLSPGHACETLAFLIEALRRDGSDLEQYLGSRPGVRRKLDGAEADTVGMLCSRAVEWTLERGWDRQYGGIFYYMDALDLPPEKLEWAMKLWWVHVESAAAALSAFRFSGKESLEEWFGKIHSYMWEKYRRQENMEWYGYLSRQGVPTHDLAGGKWKGFFHLPRALMTMILMIESKNENNSNRGNSENTF